MRSASEAFFSLGLRRPRRRCEGSGAGGLPQTPHGDFRRPADASPFPDSKLAAAHSSCFAEPHSLGIRDYNMDSLSSPQRLRQNKAKNQFSTV
jgi:hypothetical protein